MRLAPLALFLAVVSAFSQTRGEVRGSVVDAHGGEGLSNVAVALVGGAYRAVTDSSGHFAIANVEPGDYVLNVSTVGYRLIKKPFHMDANEAKEFEVILSADTLRVTDQVEITASPFETVRADSPSTLVLAGNDAKNLGSVLADDPLRAVQSLPGVSSNDDFDARFSLRGADYDRVGLYVDGVLLHMPFHTVEGTNDTGSATAFNGDMIEELELHEGAWPARYQDRTAGVLNVVTRDGNRTEPSVRFTASASNAGVMTEGPLDKKGHGTWLLGARISYIQYIVDRVMTDPSIAFGMQDIQGRMAYELTPAHKISLNLLESYSELDRSSAKSKLGINSLMGASYNFTFLNFTWRYTPVASLIVTSHAAWMREKFHDTNPNIQSLGAGLYGEWVGDQSATWMWSSKSQLDVGWSVRKQKDSGYSNQFLSTTPFVRLLDHDDGTALHGGGFAQQSWTLANGRLRLSAGVRGDKLSLDNVGAVSPQASISGAVTRTTRLDLGWGQYVQYPEISDLTSPTGGSYLLPMRANHVIAAIEQRVGDRTRLRAEFYEREDRDLEGRAFYDPRMIGNTVLVPQVNPPLKNSIRGYARGFEFFAQRSSANRVTGWISYAYGATRERDGVEHIAYPSDWDQRHTINVFGSYRLKPTVNLSAKLMYGSGFPYPGFYKKVNGVYYLSTVRNQLRFDPYYRIDWRINKSFTKDKYKITLYGEIINLTNKANYRWDNLDSYNTKTGQASIVVDRMFPIIPSAGILVER